MKYLYSPGTLYPGVVIASSRNRCARTKCGGLASCVISRWRDCLFCVRCRPISTATCYSRKSRTHSRDRSAGLDSGAQRRRGISVFIPPNQPNPSKFLWGKNDVRMAIQQFYTHPPKKQTFIPPPPQKKTNFWLRPWLDWLIDWLIKVNWCPDKTVGPYTMYMMMMTTTTTTTTTTTWHSRLLSKKCWIQCFYYLHSVTTIILPQLTFQCINQPLRSCDTNTTHRYQSDRWILATVQCT